MDVDHQVDKINRKVDINPGKPKEAQEQCRSL